jgi:beta-phosphoglucomutase family hydrolase
MNELKAVLFDIDGTLLDNNDFHKKAWMEYLKGEGKEISDEEFKDKISGRTNLDAVQHIYDKEMSVEEAEKYYLKKEEIYRKLYEPHIAPINGLIDFLKQLQESNITMALATSGIQVNIDFMFEHIPIKQYFKTIIQAKDIENGKPDPEIFIKTAEALHIPAKNCVVFEDSTSGVEAGKAAKMKVVALTTTHTPEELDKADLVIDDYTGITVDRLRTLL